MLMVCECFYSFNNIISKCKISTRISSSISSSFRIRIIERLRLCLRALISIIAISYSLLVSSYRLMEAAGDRNGASSFLFLKKKKLWVAICQWWLEGEGEISAKPAPAGALSLRWQASPERYIVCGIFLLLLLLLSYVVTGNRGVFADSYV